MNQIQIVITDENGKHPVTLDRRTFLRMLHDTLPMPIPLPASLDELLHSIFLTIGMPANIMGYYYLCKAVTLIIQSPDYMKPITRRLYPAIAARFDTSPENVERCIRHAIKITWQRGRVEQLNEMLGVHILSQADQPSSSELIALVALLAESLQSHVCDFRDSAV